MMIYDEVKQPAVAWVVIDKRMSFDIPNSADPVTGVKERMSGYYGHTSGDVPVEFYLFEKDKAKCSVLASLCPGDLVLVCTRSMELKEVAKFQRKTRWSHRQTTPKHVYKFSSPIIPFVKQKNSGGIHPNWRVDGMKSLLRISGETLARFHKFFSVYC